MKRLVIIFLFGALGACLIPAAAQSADWQSTSSLPGSGSAYSSQVTAVGATTVESQATTTGSYAPAKAPGGPRRSFGENQDGGEKNPDSPVGDAVLPLLLMAAAGGVAVAVRRRRSTRVAGE